MKRKGILILMLSAALLAPVTSTAADSRLPSLIPRDVLFGNATHLDPLISPDGTRLAYLAPSSEGVMNVWVRTIGRNDDKIVSRDRKRGIRAHSWTRDSRRILYLQDDEGDENFHVFMVDLEKGLTRNLTPFPGVRAVNMIPLKDGFLVGLNLRNRQLFDMYRIDLETGAVDLDTENPGDVPFLIGSEWVADRKGVIRAVKAMNMEDGSTVLKVRGDKDEPWHELASWSFGDSLIDGYVNGFSADGRSLFLFSSMGSDTTRLVRMDAQTGQETEVIAGHAKADLWIEDVIVDPGSGRVQAAAFEVLKPEWMILDPSLQADFDKLGMLPGHFRIISRDSRDLKWTVSCEADHSPKTYYIYDREKCSLELLFSSRSELGEYRLATTTPVVITARDGLELASYLTLPPGLKPQGLPLVLYVHGGPTARDTWGFDPKVQFLANRGYAVLQVNFRGSVGFGKSFERAGNGQVGVGSMQHDLTDAVRWAIERGYADPERVAIMGGSYGGFAVLAGLAFTSDLYACGVDMCGPSNLRTMFESIPPYYVPLKKQFGRIFGDVENDDAYNRRVSPLFHARNIRSPLLVAQGANDPRCKMKESDQIVAAVREAGLPVTYVVYSDEGHGLTRSENNLDFFARVEVFLAGHLGGRSEAFDGIPGSSAQMR